jgi:hypothetical protein
VANAGAPVSLGDADDFACWLNVLEGDGECGSFLVVGCGIGVGVVVLGGGYWRERLASAL